jgi:uncharacterized phage protein (TIGR01671 family)
MDREIKFRAWDTRRKNMYPNLTIQRLMGNLFTARELRKKIEDLVWMQYAGLKDKDGKEIYEGDIVKWFDDLGENSQPFVVEFDEAHFILTVPNEKLEGWSLDGKKIKVIGNIYENPDLFGRLTN